ncbi:hypothetical protein CERSUDRAFT_160532 [Gelatoporia subvermispora B]|uniref:BRCT domain-containing protein n=1 Tax=Ceriporiopsis subvermispora (strain B) TaxID=914234 RepID=M2QMZ7_CERS8|nr:hypothetical protein CERSUDRAFT_160532 [Gelatoporia subvermispora B]
MPGPMRRRNKSNKIPNVKLRPAAPAPSNSRASRTPTSDHFLQDDEDVLGETQASILESCPRPFRGITLCTTGISDKTTLFKQAIELGAQYDSDLRDNITHLVAEVPGSAKYKCALANKIPIMHPSWVTDSYEIWLRGDDVDVQEMTRKHRLPIFSGVILVLSGFEDIERRTEINRLCTEEGGTYVKNIERPVKVTHLLCSSHSDAVTDKMKYAEKFNQRGEANIRVVWEEWFWDCLEFGGEFEEADYEVSKPPPERKSRSQGTWPSSQNAAPFDIPESHTPSLGRQVGPGDEEEIAAVKRVPAITLQLWESLLKPRGFELVEGKLVRSPSKSQPVRRNDEQGDFRPSRSPTRVVPPVPIPGPQRGESSTIAALRKPIARRNELSASAGDVTNAGAPPTAEGSVFRRRVQHLGPASSFLSYAPGRSGSVDDIGADAQPVASSSRQRTSGPSEHVDVPLGESSVLILETKLFAGLRFKALGEADSPAVYGAIRHSGGIMLASDSQDIDNVDFIIIRLASDSDIYREEPNEAIRERFRTECWLESCITQERICALDEHIAFRPLRIETPVPGMDAIVLTYSGLDESEACWIRRLARALGFHVAPKFSRQSTHLLCPSGVGPKADKAREWGIPIVDMAWLAEIACTGRLPLVPEESREVLCPVDSKGKGKERAQDIRMADITNSEDSEIAPAAVPTIPAAGDSGGHDEESKPASPQRHAADEEDLHFGGPGALLGGLERQFSDATPPPISRATTLELDLPNGTPSRPRNGNAMFSRKPSEKKTESRDDPGRIPSSESPSPMKLLPDANVPAPSPADKTKQAAKMLQESITTLLGKRPSSEDDLARQQSRKGKRLRVPSKTKAFKRQHSGTDADRAPLLMPEAVVDSAFKAEYTADDDDIGIRAAAGEDHADNSMRVTYEDPGQRTEQKRLLRLLDGQSCEEDSQPAAAASAKGRKGEDARRRSARISAS